MFKDHRYINAGENEFYRYGKKAVAKVEACMVARNGYISIAADGDKYWTFGTSNGKYGEFAKIGDTIFSVNSAGFIWAKEGTEKADKLVDALKALVVVMNKKNAERAIEKDEEEEE